MTDLPPTPEPTPEVPAETPPVVPEPSHVGVVIPEDLDTDLPESVQQFDREYVVGLRKQAAGYRTAAAPYKDVFGEASEQERDFLLGLNQKLLTDPDAAAGDLVALARQLAGDQFDNLLTPQAPTPLTAEEAQALWDRNETSRKEQEANASAEAAVMSEIKELGYEPNTAKTAELFWRSLNQHDGDLKAAHAAIEADRQAVIDDYVKSKAEGNDKFQPVSSNAGTGGADPTGHAPRTPAEARASAEARLAALAGDN